MKTFIIKNKKDLEKYRDDDEIAKVDVIEHEYEIVSECCGAMVSDYGFCTDCHDNAVGIKYCITCEDKECGKEKEE